MVLKSVKTDSGFGFRGRYNKEKYFEGPVEFDQDGLENIDAFWDDERWRIGSDESAAASTLPANNVSVQKVDYVVDVDAIQNEHQHQHQPSTPSFGIAGSMASMQLGSPSPGLPSFKQTPIPQRSVGGGSSSRFGRVLESDTPLSAQPPHRHALAAETRSLSRVGADLNTPLSNSSTSRTSFTTTTTTTKTSSQSSMLSPNSSMLQNSRINASFLDSDSVFPDDEDDISIFQPDNDDSGMRDVEDDPLDQSSTMGPIGSPAINARPQRTRRLPLDRWRNERVKYKPDPDAPDDLSAAVVEVIRNRGPRTPGMPKSKSTRVVIPKGERL